MRRYLIIAFVIFGFSKLEAQDYRKEGDSFFEELNYKAAIEQYEKAFKKDSSEVELRHNMAICYLNLNIDRKVAIPLLEWVTKQEKFDEYAWYDLARAYHYNHQFDKAIATYKKYIANGKDDEFLKLAKLGQKQCKSAKKLIPKPIDVDFFPLNDEINTEHNEFQPYIPADESTLVFTSDEKYDSRYKIHINNIYITEKEGADWDRPRRVGVVNSSEDEFVAGLAANDKYLFIKYQRYEAFDDIFIAEKDIMRIGRPENLGEKINSGAVESGATLSYSGDTLIFSSNRDGGKGGMDLWMSIKLPNGEWGIPINLGEPINTPYDEDFPHIMPDGKTMFFSSTGHTSMGGYDVFKTKLNNEGKWGKPQNFGYPVNNTYDNYTIAMSRNYRYAYVSDVREEGKGGMDIYRVVFKNVGAGFFLHKGTFTNNENQPVNLDELELPPIEVYNAGTEKLVGKYKYNMQKEEFVMALKPGEYNLKIDIKGYAPVNEKVIVPDLLKNKIYNIKIVLQPE